MIGRRRVGRTDIRVSPVAMGCWAIAGDHTWGPQDEADSIATIHAALDVDINLFDTAEGYGDGYSEEVVGKALRERRHEAVIATKVSVNHLAKEEIVKACERSLKRLQTDYIDLYQIHWPSRTVPLAESMEALERLKEQGKIRAIGVCNFAVQDLTELLAIGHVETDQLPYSLLWRAIEYGIQPKCVENQIGILCYSPLLQGLLTGKFASADGVPESRGRTRHFSRDRAETRHGEPEHEKETFQAIARIRRICEEIGQPMAEVALAWLLYQPAVTSVLAGARHPEQIHQNARAAELALSSGAVYVLTEATTELKELFGTNPDMWQSASHSRMR